MQLSDEEREHIRLVEEYRAEVREKLESKKNESRLGSMVEKFAMPVLIVGLSAFLAPVILGRIENERREFDLQSRLIEQIVGDDAAAQVNLYQYRNQYADFRISLMDIEWDKRMLALRSLDAAERQVRRSEIQQELERARNVYYQKYDTFTTSIDKYFVEQRGNVEWVKLHYGQTAQLDAYLKAAKDQHNQAVTDLKPYQDDLADMTDRAAKAFLKCPDEPSCQRIYNDAREEVLAHRDRQPKFEAWETAKSTLIKFISETRPRL